MTDEERELFESYKKECEAVYELATRLDAFNPEEPGAFTGKPSERIERQLRAQKVAGFLSILES